MCATDSGLSRTHSRISGTGPSSRIATIVGPRSGKVTSNWNRIHISHGANGGAAQVEIRPTGRVPPDLADIGSDRARRSLPHRGATNRPTGRQAISDGLRSLECSKPRPARRRRPPSKSQTPLALAHRANHARARRARALGAGGEQRVVLAAVQREFERGDAEARSQRAQSGAERRRQRSRGQSATRRRSPARGAARRPPSRRRCRSRRARRAPSSRPAASCACGRRNALSARRAAALVPRRVPACKSRNPAAAKPSSPAQPELVADARAAAQQRATLHTADDRGRDAELGAARQIAAHDRTTQGARGRALSARQLSRARRRQSWLGRSRWTAPRRAPRPSRSRHWRPLESCDSRDRRATARRARSARARPRCRPSTPSARRT